MGSLANVLPEVDGPEERTVQAVGLQEGFARRATLGIIPRALFLLEDNFVVAVTVQIADRRIVGRVARGCLERNGVIGKRGEVRRKGVGLAGFAFDPRDHRLDLIRGGPAQIRPGVDQPRGAGHGNRIDLDGGRFAL
jgi:hypothetical protein